MTTKHPVTTSVTRHVSYCRICEQLCGIVADISEGEVVRIRGDILHPVSDGYICPKGAMMGQVQSDPDRVRHPLKRAANSEFIEVDWDTALDDIAGRLRRLRREYGPDSIAMYLGNPSAFSLSHIFWAKGLIDAIGSRHFYSAMSQDNASRSAASHFLFGSPMLFPIPDILRTDFLLVFGANPMVSHGGLITVPPIGDRLRAITARGGWVVVVDPARTKTAASFEHQPIRPATDAWLLGAMINVLFEEGLVDRKTVSGHAIGLGLAALVNLFGPERVVVSGEGLSAFDLFEDQLRQAFAAQAFGSAVRCTSGYGTCPHKMRSAFATSDRAMVRSTKPGSTARTASRKRSRTLKLRSLKSGPP